MFATLSVLMTGSAIRKLGHMTFYDGEWREGFKLQKPVVNFQARLFKTGYTKLGRQVPRTLVKSIVASFMLDSGASISVAGLKLLKILGIRKEDLLQTKLTVTSADSSKMTILGVVCSILNINIKTLGILL